MIFSWDTSHTQPEFFLWDELTDTLTFANTEDVFLFSEQQRQTLHQQESFMVAQGWRFPLMEHLVQRGSLNLRWQQDARANTWFILGFIKISYNAAGTHNEPLFCEK